MRGEATDDSGQTKQRHGVDISGVARDEGESGVALILVDARGENVIAVAPGANRRLTASDVDVGDCDAVMCQMEIPLEAIAAAAAAAPFWCLIDFQCECPATGVPFVQRFFVAFGFDAPLSDDSAGPPSSAPFVFFRAPFRDCFAK